MYILSNMVYSLLVTFVAGLVFGVIITRYGIGLGIKIVYRIKDNVPLDSDIKPTEQEITGE